MLDERLSSMKLSELQKELRAKGLSTKGLKAELIKRLQDSMHEASKDAGMKRNAPDDPGEGNMQGEETEGELPMKQPRTDRPCVQHSDEHQSTATGEELLIKVRQTNQARIVIEREGDDGVVKVINGYDLKDRCRAAGFKFDAAERAWVTPIFALLHGMGVSSLDQIEHDDIMDYLQRIEVGEALASQPKEQEELEAEVDGDMVSLKGNTYAWKDKIRSAGFRWDSTRSCWRRPLDQVLLWLKSVKSGAADEEANVEEHVIRAITEISQEELARASPAQVEQLQPHLKVEKEEVERFDGSLLVLTISCRFAFTTPTTSKITCGSWAFASTCRKSAGARG